MKDTNSYKEILPYQEFWKQKFEKEKSNLVEIFKDEAIAIEHIGSTSIPGLSSKNIIDIAVLIDHPESAEKFVGALEKLGYRYDTQGTSTERHFFRKYGEDNFHISIAYKTQGSFWERQILFRDFLRGSDKFREEYQELKEDLIKKDPTGGNEYISGKTEFVERVLTLAGFGGASYWKEK